MHRSGKKFGGKAVTKKLVRIRFLAFFGLYDLRNSIFLFGANLWHKRRLKLKFGRIWSIGSTFKLVFVMVFFVKIIDDFLWTSVHLH